MPADIVTIIQSVGFPIFVAAYLMIKMNATIQKNTEAILSISEFIRAGSKEG